MSTVRRHLLTADEFAALPHAGLRTELIRGEIVAMPPAFADHGEVAAMLAVRLGQYVYSKGLGRLCAAETGFLVAEQPDTVRAPELAFTRSERVPPRGAPGWVRVMPDLVAEVVSSGDRTGEIGEKVRMWRDVGVHLVWVVYPTPRIVEVWRAGEPTLVLHENDQLAGYDVVPGFACPVAQLFA